jgi:uncharacterized protein YciI
MKHYLLIYEGTADYAVRRTPYRQEHLSLAWAAHERGELLLGGAFADPVDGAVLLFQSATREVVEQFVANDPYVRHGVVQRWSIREWATVVGDAAITPIRPTNGV